MTAQLHASLKIRQRQGFCAASFEFGERELTYTFDNARSKAGGIVPYHKLPERWSFREVRLWWFRYVAVFYLTLCTLTTTAYMGVGDIEMAVGALYVATMMFLVVCLWALLRMPVATTTFALNPPLVVLHNRKFDEVMEELSLRRREGMRRKLMEVNLTRPYYEEAGKFSWLREEGVVSEEEYQQARAQLVAAQQAAKKP